MVRRQQHWPHQLGLMLYCWLLLLLVSPPVVVVMAGRGAGVVITPVETKVMRRQMMNSDNVNNNNNNNKSMKQKRRSKDDEDKPSMSSPTTGKSPHAPAAQRPTKPTIDLKKPSPTSSPHAGSPVGRPTKPTAPPKPTTTTTDMPSTASAPTSVVALVQLPNLSFEAQQASNGNAATTMSSIEMAVERFWQEFLSKTYGGAYRSVDLETTTTIDSADDSSGSNTSIYVNVTGTALFNGPPDPDTNVRADLREYLLKGDGASALVNFLLSSGADITTIALDGEVVIGGEPIIANPPAPGPITTITWSETGFLFPTITFDAAAFNTTEAAVDRGVERFLQDFLKREYPEDYLRTEVETTIRPAGSGRINATTTGEAIFKTGPAEDTALRDGLAEYLANDGDAVLADFLTTTGITDIQNLALDGVPVVVQSPEKSDETKSSRNNTGAIIGGVVGGIAACLLCCWLASCFVTNRPDEGDGNANEVAEVAEEGKGRVGDE
jgi:hypothetical protein